MTQSRVHGKRNGGRPLRCGCRSFGTRLWHGPGSADSAVPRSRLYGRRVVVPGRCVGIGGTGRALRAGRSAAVALTALLTCAACGTVSAVTNTLTGGPGPQPGQTGFVRGFLGGVVADEPEAALVGRQALSAGGNAADAAVAAAFALTVTLPSRAGIGGSGACIAYQPGRDFAEQGHPRGHPVHAASPAAAAIGSGRPSCGAAHSATWAVSAARPLWPSAVRAAGRTGRATCAGWHAGLARLGRGSTPRFRPAVRGPGGAGHVQPEWRSPGRGPTIAPARPGLDARANPRRRRRRFLPRHSGASHCAADTADRRTAASSGTLFRAAARSAADHARLAERKRIVSAAAGRWRAGRRGRLPGARTRSGGSGPGG